MGVNLLFLSKKPKVTQDDSFFYEDDEKREYIVKVNRTKWFKVGGDGKIALTGDIHKAQPFESEYRAKDVQRMCGGEIVERVTVVYYTSID